MVFRSLIAYIMNLWSKKFLDDFFCIITNQNFTAITLGIHSTFFVIICSWHKVGFHWAFPLKSFDFLSATVTQDNLSKFRNSVCYLIVKHSCERYHFSNRLSVIRKCFYRIFFFRNH